MESMSIREYDILIDIMTGDVSLKNLPRDTIIEFIKDDTKANKLNIELQSNGKPYIIGDNDVQIAFFKYNKDIVTMDKGVDELNVINNIIHCTLRPDILSLIGRQVVAEVIIKGANKIRLTSAKFAFYVKKGIIDDSNIRQLDNYNILTDMQNQVENLLIDIEENIIPEEERRVLVENERVVVFNGIVNTATTTKDGLDNSIEEANLINNIISNEVDGSIKQARDINNNLNNTFNLANDLNQAISNEDNGTIKRATDINTIVNNTINSAEIKHGELGSRIQLSEQAKTELNESISISEDKKVLLDNSISDGNSVRVSLENITNIANTTNENLNNSIYLANDEKLDLNNSISVGQTTKNNLDNSIELGQTTKGNLDESVGGATNINGQLINSIDGATDINEALIATKQLSNNANIALNTTIEDANTSKISLNNSIELADTTKSNLDGSIGLAQTTKENLDGSISSGGATKTNLDGSITSANSIKSGLDTSIVNGGVLKTDIEQAIIENQIVKKPEFTALKEDYVQHKLDYVEDKKPFHYNHAAQEYLNVDKYWDSFRDGKIYTVEFNQYSVSPNSSGVKKDDNTELVCEPSTNTIRSRNNYEKIGLFMSIDVNAYVDEKGDYHVIAIDGDGRFANDGAMGDVYVMSMVGYQKRYETDTAWGISYSDTMHAGFEVLNEAEKMDGTIRPFLLHAKYVAGRNPHENNDLASISGVYPEYSGMSHNGQITEFAKKGSQYSGKTSHDDYYVQLMMWLKYATTNSDTIMKGCQSYYLQYTSLVAEIGVKRVIITNAQANNLLVGSTVSIGDYEGSTQMSDRQQARNYNKANRVNIISIEDLGDGNSAVYVDSAEVFDTTLTTTITTYPWNSGGCDNVLGQDGSPYDNQSGKEPFIINGIEMIVGGYEVLQNLIIHNNNIDNKIDVYANYDCKTYATSPNANYDLVGQLAQTNNTWKYGSKMVVPKNHPSVILVTEADASSTLGTGDGIYTNAPSVGGYRVWHSLGVLLRGTICGLRCLHASNDLSSAYWYILGRLSATGRSRRRAGVN